MLCEWIRGGQLLHFLETEDHGHAENSLGLKTYLQDSPGGPGVKNPPANAGCTDLIPSPEDPTCHGATESTGHDY